VLKSNLPTRHTDYNLVGVAILTMVLGVPAAVDEDFQRKPALGELVEVRTIENPDLPVVF
jgi:hypothetical protein